MADTNTLIKDSYLMDEKLGAGLEKLWNAIQSEAGTTARDDPASCPLRAFKEESGSAGKWVWRALQNNRENRACV
jgi:hypothetical protein